MGKPSWGHPKAFTIQAHLHMGRPSPFCALRGPLQKVGGVWAESPAPALALRRPRPRWPGRPPPPRRPPPREGGPGSRPPRTAATRDPAAAKADRRQAAGGGAVGRPTPCETWGTEAVGGCWGWTGLCMGMWRGHSARGGAYRMRPGRPSPSGVSSSSCSAATARPRAACAQPSSGSHLEKAGGQGRDGIPTSNKPACGDRAALAVPVGGT